jgi:F-box-like
MSRLHSPKIPSLFHVQAAEACIIQIRNPNVFSPDDANTMTSSSAGDLLDEMRSIIDRDIARLEERIRALKSRRNELSPISRLPAEILCNIFSLSISWSPQSWTNFSQVSQHWRSLALSAPELWTDIPLGYSRWAEEMLIRSKEAKLTIRCSGIYLKHIATVRSCLYEMNRVEEIALGPLPESMLEEIFRDLPRSAPQLHTLRISTGYFSETAFPIHEDFLYDTERLKCVELNNCKISWDSRLLTGLTRLTIEVGDFLEMNSSINQFLHALQRMPALTDLHLEDSIPDDSESPSTYPFVDLPCLRVLRISSGVGPLTTVLRHITFPRSAILNLTCKETQSTQIDFSNFLSVLATSTKLSSLVIRSLSLRALGGIQTHSLKFCLWTTAFIQDCFPCPPMYSTKLQLVLTWPSSQTHASNHVKALTCAFDAINLPFLTQFQISTLDLNYIDSQTWVKTFGKLPLLERVCLQGYVSHSFLDALIYKTEAAEKSKTAYHNVSFPNLRYIHLEGAVFFPKSSRSLSVDMLLDCLMERYERNAAVQVLRLDDCCSIASYDVERLKEIVVDVIWDGVEQQKSLEDSEEDYDHDSDNEDAIFDELEHDYDDPDFFE